MPLLTVCESQQLHRARAAGAAQLEVSIDLQRSLTLVNLLPETWGWNGYHFPYPAAFKERTIYYWNGEEFAAAARFGNSLIKLVPTKWGAPTFEIDGIKMLPSEHDSPFADAARKVRLIEPRGKVVLDTCGGLGYFAACCRSGGAARIRSFEKDGDVIWLRSLNPWSPPAGTELTLEHADVLNAIEEVDTGSMDAVLHDPPRFGIAGDLYSAVFYAQLARVLRNRGRLFHYTGSPNKLTTGRDVPGEVSRRLEEAGFRTERVLDGVLAVKRHHAVKRR